MGLVWTAIINHISAIDGVDEVRRLDEDDDLFDF